MGEGKNKAEAAVRKWLAERGYDYEICRTYSAGNVFAVHVWGRGLYP